MSRVTGAEGWLSIRGTAFTLARAEIASEATQVSANTWEGFRVVFSLETRTLLDSSFVK